nr:MAG TPA: hypothetical protein [Caudoviricetes sp.]
MTNSITCYDLFDFSTPHAPPHIPVSLPAPMLTVPVLTAPLPKPPNHTFNQLPHLPVATSHNLKMRTKNHRPLLTGGFKCVLLFLTVLFLLLLT